MAQLKRLIAKHRVFLLFFFGIVLLRSVVVDWYQVPSASMYPTLLIGDRIIANRLAYDLKLPFTDIIIRRIADPQRGDIVTFDSPLDGLRLAKRVIGLPGDVVQMRANRLIVNGVEASYAAGRLASTAHEEQTTLTEQLSGHQHTIILMPARKAFRSFGPVTVPADAYLVLGDNRDNSKDSRYIGFIRRTSLTGQVRSAIFSLDAENYYLPRQDRFAAGVR